VDSTELIAQCDRLVALAARRLELPTANLAAEARARQLHGHLEGFVRPRLADIDAPLLVLLLGPTGAGKSSLLNTIAGPRQPMRFFTRARPIRIELSRAVASAPSRRRG